MKVQSKSRVTRGSDPFLLSISRSRTPNRRRKPHEGACMTAQFTILCIEDEEDLRTDIAEELVAAKYDVLQASNGQEAIAILQHRRPDLVLCDITMPGLGGYDVHKAMREKGDLADVPFIFLTAL